MKKPKAKLSMERTAKAYASYWKAWAAFSATIDASIKQADAALDKLDEAELAFKNAFADDTAHVNCRENAMLVGPGPWVTMLLAKYGPDWVQPQVKECIASMRKLGHYSYEVEART